MHPKRIEAVTRYILEHFNQKTYRGDRNYRYEHDVLTNVTEVVADRRRDKTEEVHGKKEAVGFNSIFAVFSVDAAKAYYEEFQKQMKKDPSKHLKIAVIYSCGTNEEEPDGIIADENLEDLSGLNASDKAFLEDAMRDYEEIGRKLDALLAARRGEEYFNSLPFDRNEPTFIPDENGDSRMSAIASRSAAMIPGTAITARPP